MNSQELCAYSAFLQTGRVCDYLNYIEAKRELPTVPSAPTGEEHAYYDQRDCAAGTCG